MDVKQNLQAAPTPEQVAQARDRLVKVQDALALNDNFLLDYVVQYTGLNLEFMFNAPVAGLAGMKEDSMRLAFLSGARAVAAHLQAAMNLTMEKFDEIHGGAK